MKFDMTNLWYYAEYSRKMASGNHLKLRGVFSAKDLSWYLTNYSPKYEYMFEMIRVATSEEIEEFNKLEERYE